jgi:hypothetical protein
MAVKNKYNLEELIFVEPVKDQKQNRGQEKVNVELVVEQVFKQLDKDHL